MFNRQIQFVIDLNKLSSERKKNNLIVVCSRKHFQRLGQLHDDGDRSECRPHRKVHGDGAAHVQPTAERSSERTGRKTQSLEYFATRAVSQDCDPVRKRYPKNDPYSFNCFSGKRHQLF